MKVTGRKPKRLLASLIAAALIIGLLPAAMAAQSTTLQEWDSTSGFAGWSGDHVTTSDSALTLSGVTLKSGSDGWGNWDQKYYIKWTGTALDLTDAESISLDLTYNPSQLTENCGLRVQVAFPKVGNGYSKDASKGSHNTTATTATETFTFALDGDFKSNATAVDEIAFSVLGTGNGQVTGDTNVYTNDLTISNIKIIKAATDYSGTINISGNDVPFKKSNWQLDWGTNNSKLSVTADGKLSMTGAAFVKDSYDAGKSYTLSWSGDGLDLSGCNCGEFVIECPDDKIGDGFKVEFGWKGHSASYPDVVKAGSGQYKVGLKLAAADSSNTGALTIKIVAKGDTVPTPDSGTIQVSGLKFWHEDEPVKPATTINNVTGTWDGVTGASASNNVLTLLANITGTGNWNQTDTVAATWTAADGGALGLPADTNQVKMTLTYDTTQITGEEKLNILVSVGGVETNGQQIDSTGNGTVSFVQSLKDNLSGQSTLTVKIHAESGTAYNGNFTISNISFATVEQSDPAGTPDGPVWDFSSSMEGWKIGWGWNYNTSEATVKRVNGMLRLRMHMDPSAAEESGGSLTLQWDGGSTAVADLNGKDYVTMDVLYNADAITGPNPTLKIGAKAGDDETILASAVAAVLDPAQATGITAPNGEAGSWKKQTVTIGFDQTSAKISDFRIELGGSKTTEYNDAIYLDNIDFKAAEHGIVTAKVSDDTNWKVSIVPSGKQPIPDDGKITFTLTAINDWQEIGSLTVTGAETTTIPVSEMEGNSRKATWIFDSSKYAAGEGNSYTVAVVPAAASGGGGGGGGGGGSTPAVKGDNTTTPAESAGESLTTTVATVSKGIASATVTDETVDSIIKDVAANTEAGKATGTVTIAVETAAADSGKVTASQVSIPAESLAKLAESTSADLRVESSVAAITVTAQSVAGLGRGEGSVVFSASKSSDGKVDISVTADGERLDTIPGGLKAEVVMDCNSGTVAVLVKPDGTTVPLRRSFADEYGESMNVSLDGSATLQFVDKHMNFVDIPQTHWAKEAIDFASSRELLVGVGGGQFDPNGTVNRAMLVKVLHNLEYNPEGAAQGAFPDVAEESWYAEAVNWATGSGLIKGYDDGAFHGETLISRQDLAVVIYRYAGEPEVTADLSKFSDAGDAGNYAVKALTWAVDNGLITGVKAQQLDPKGTMTRHQIAKLMMNIVRLGIGE